MEQFDALDVIARTRGKVEMDSVPTGARLFPLWGWLTAVFYLAAFLLILLLNQDWAGWLWIGIPVIGIPWMIIILRREHAKAHMRTRKSRLVLDYWIFAAFAIGIGGFIFGFADIYEIAENPLICLLVGIGALITGEELRFRPMIVGGLVAASIGIGAFLLQGELWVWQELCVVATAVSALIIPGHMFEKQANGV
jgi:hypothetical protein